MNNTQAKIKVSNVLDTLQTLGAEMLDEHEACHSLKSAVMSLKHVEKIMIRLAREEQAELLTEYRGEVA